MIPYRQTIFHGDLQGRKGDCFRTAIGSVLEINPSEIPHFAESEDWYLDFLRWLLKLGYEAEKSNYPDIPSGYAIAVGDSPRGDFLHCIVVLDGVHEHDPHPSNDGLINTTHYYIKIIKL